MLPCDEPRWYSHRKGARSEPSPSLHSVELLLQMSKEETLKVHEMMVRTHVMDKIFYEAQRQVRRPL